MAVTADSPQRRISAAEGSSAENLSLPGFVFSVIEPRILRETEFQNQRNLSLQFLRLPAMR
jgi:hypothetical protein